MEEQHGLLWEERHLASDVAVGAADGAVELVVLAAQVMAQEQAKYAVSKIQLKPSMVQLREPQAVAMIAVELPQCESMALMA